LHLDKPAEGSKSCEKAKKNVVNDGTPARKKRTLENPDNDPG
jgi:hypothetical protein